MQACIERMVWSEMRRAAVFLPMSRVATCWAAVCHVVLRCTAVCCVVLCCAGLYWAVPCRAEAESEPPIDMTIEFASPAPLA